MEMCHNNRSKLNNLNESITNMISKCLVLFFVDFLENKKVRLKVNLNNFNLMAVKSSQQLQRQRKHENAYFKMIMLVLDIVIHVNGLEIKSNPKNLLSFEARILYSFLLQSDVELTADIHT